MMKMTIVKELMNRVPVNVQTTLFIAGGLISLA